MRYRDRRAAAGAKRRLSDKSGGHKPAPGPGTQGRHGETCPGHSHSSTTVITR